MCRDGYTCIGLLAMVWPVVGLAAIGCIYLRQFVRWWLCTAPRTCVEPLPAPKRYKSRFHNEKGLDDNG